MGWKSGDKHPSKGKTKEKLGDQEHFDVEEYDEVTKKKIKKSGKLHISGEPHEPSMRDIHPPSKEKEKEG